MRQYNNNLTNRLSALGKQAKIENQKKDSKIEDFREQRIKFLENMIKSKEKDIEYLRSLAKKFNRILSNINNFYILKKLGTFGANEFSFKNNALNIQRNDILLVDNPNIFSSSVIDYLKEKVFVVVYKKPIAKKIENRLPFVFISAENLNIEEDEYFGFVEKKHFEVEKNKSNWLKKIIQDYKNEKEQLILK